MLLNFLLFRRVQIQNNMSVDIWMNVLTSISLPLLSLAPTPMTPPLFWLTACIFSDWAWFPSTALCLPVNTSWMQTATKTEWLNSLHVHLPCGQRSGPADLLRLFAVCIYLILQGKRVLCLFSGKLTLNWPQVQRQTRIFTYYLENAF